MGFPPLSKGVFPIFRRKKVSEPQNVDYIICGLGNPGSKYEMTRHNVGFVALDLLAEKAGLGRLTKTKCKAVYGTGTIAGKSVLLMKPQTYMNLSGEAVRDMMQAFSVPPERLIVIFDDADLAPGRIRIRKKRFRRYPHRYAKHRLPVGERQVPPHQGRHRQAR